MRKQNRNITIAMAACLALLSASCSKKQTVQLQTTQIEAADICESVTATGTLESVSQVDVGTQVTGIVAKLFADYNSEVKEGQLLAEIDKTTLESELKSADANLQSAKLEYEYAKKNYDRDKQLHDKMLISDYEFDTTRKTFLVAQQTYEKCKADRVRSARNMSYAEIYSPINGIVISREVEVGQTVVSSMNVANIFTIADLDNMRVVANVDEADIGAVKEGQNATFTVDAFPNDVFSGVVTQVRINPTTTSNVVTYEVLISASNPDHKLIPGLTANITINTKEARNVLTLPLKALRFTPQEFEGDNNLPTFDMATVPQRNNNQPSPLNPDEKPKDPAVPTEDMHRLVWVLQGNQLVPTEIELGVDDGVNVQVLNGLKKGDVVAVSYIEPSENEPKSGEQAQSPFAPKRPGSDKKSK
ncbi:MAG: efflux RND transporter periplasmic adaptor subunit [Muribaculaceae bacterium]